MEPGGAVGGSGSGGGVGGGIGATAGANAGTSSAGLQLLPSPNAVHPKDWSLQQVLAWLQTLQPVTISQQHAGKFREHGIEGEVLIQLDADALRDMEISSVGHRLVLLRGIYDLKRKWNVELEADDWRPDIATVEVRNGSGSGTTTTAYTSSKRHSAVNADLVRALQERDERLWALEDEVARLVDWLRRYTDEGAGTKTIEALRPYLPPAKAYAGGRVATNGTPLISLQHLGHANASVGIGGGSEDNGMGSGSSRGSRTPQTATAFRNVYSNLTDMSHSHSPQGAPGNVSQVGFSPTSSTPGATPTTAHPPISLANDASIKAGQPPYASTPLLQGAGSGAGDLTLSSLTTTSANGTPTTMPIGAGTAASLSPSSPLAMGGLGSGKKDRLSSGSGSSANGDGPYKSFRVTLDDPCYKVLPAALKKYKINDDWRQYALFICYGTTERCLSYDEKPLLLFQKLKENKQSPVFMLRHIRDVKSPIAIANAKAAARKLTAEGGTAGSGKVTPASPSTQRSGVSKVADAVAKFGGTSGKETGNGTAGGNDAHDRTDSAMIDSPPGQPRLTGPAAQLGAEGRLLDAGHGATASANPSGTETYAIAIYPYVSERQDEFDVNVGDTFIVKSKAKGWWVVQRDARAKGQPAIEGIVHNVDGSARNGGEIKSGWVPAGCLLETRQPLSMTISLPSHFGDPSTDDPTSPRTPQAVSRMEEAQKNGASASGENLNALALHMANVPIPPSLITSTSTPGILLMDYNDDGAKIHLKKDQRLRVFKRYNHWSYCVEEGGQHTRAWLPSWYIGKVAGSASRSGTSTSSSSSTPLATGSSRLTAGSATSTPTGNSLPTIAHPLRSSVAG